MRVGRWDFDQRFPSETSRMLLQKTVRGFLQLDMALNSFISGEGLWAYQKQNGACECEGEVIAHNETVLPESDQR